VWLGEQTDDRGAPIRVRRSILETGDPSSGPFAPRAILARPHGEDGRAEDRARRVRRTAACEARPALRATGWRGAGRAGARGGGEGGIRTPGTLTGTPDFESGAFNQALPPLRAQTRRFPSRRKALAAPPRSRRSDPPPGGEPGRGCRRSSLVPPQFGLAQAGAPILPGGRGEGQRLVREDGRAAAVPAPPRARGASGRPLGLRAGVGGRLDFGTVDHRESPRAEVSDEPLGRPAGPGRSRRPPVDR
jgi:hypothetical protein